MELIKTSLFNDANLLSYWRMEGNSNDSKGSINGTDTAITYSAANGKFGQGAGFNGSTSIITFGNNLNLTTGAFTMTAWIKTSTNATQFIMGKSDSSNGPLYEMRTNTTVVEVNFFLNVGGRDICTGVTAINDGKWHFAVGLRNGTNVQLYIDGKLDQSVTDNARNCSNALNFTIGKDHNAVNFPINGQIDDASIWSRALTVNEIARLYLAGPGGSNLALLGVG